jgi:hypothetical protein
VDHATWRRPALVAIAVLSLASAVTLLYAPWLPGWNGYRAYTAHARGEYVEAIRWYERSGELGQDKTWVLHGVTGCQLASGQLDAGHASLASLRAIAPITAAEIDAWMADAGIP